VLEEIASAAESAVAREDRPPWWQRVLHDGAFDTLAFIDVCTRAHAGSPEETVARILQRIEMAMLLEESLEAVGSSVSPR
jgi:hypothetical protein